MTDLADLTEVKINKMKNMWSWKQNKGLSIVEIWKGGPLLAKRSTSSEVGRP